jgi:ParB-like nuclease domain
MQIFEIGIDELIPSPRVLRKNDRAVARMMAVIKEYGIAIPILGRHRGEKIEIVHGHLRVKASRKIGLPTIPVVFCDGWTEAQVRAFRLLVNRSSSWADWDEELLTLELADLNALDIDLSMTGFDPFEIDKFLFPDLPGSSADDVPALPTTVVSRMGDLYLLDLHRILVGDATSPEAVAKVNRKEIPRVFLSAPPTE